MRLRKTLVLAVMMFACTALSSTKRYPTPRSFAHVTSSAGRYEASSDGVSVSSPGVAFQFTVPALHVHRMRCSASVYGERSKPLVMSLLQTDGTVLATASSCRDTTPGSACQLSVTCPASTDHTTSFVLLVEPGPAGATTVSAGVTASDPYE